MLLLNSFEPVAKPAAARPFPRCPVVPVALAVIFGILIDRLIPLSSSCFGLMVTWAVVLMTVISFQLWRRTVSTVLLLVGCLCLGATWHHERWNCRSENDLSAWASERGRVVRLRAKVLQFPVVHLVPDAAKTPWRASERTVTVVECRNLVSGVAESQSVSGFARLSMDGRNERLAIGDLIEMTCQVIRPDVSSNPGGFNVRDSLQSQGIHSVLSVQFEAAVQIIGRERTFWDWFAVVRSHARRRAEKLIATRLSHRTAPVAQSLLLGSRVDLDPDVRRAFAESGTLHVLAISGMNVGLLWGWLWMVCRSFRFSGRASLIAVLCLLPSYAILTDANPPVVRATIVAVVMALGQLLGRSSLGWNSLAIAALCVLAWNPSDLFNSGAQLSFLAVFSILMSMRFLDSMRGNIVDHDVSLDAGPIWRICRAWLQRNVLECYFVGLAIWLVTSPLIASDFHLVSPMGLLLNVILSPLIGLMFWLGYSFLLLGLLSPPVFGWMGVPFDWTLGWFLSTVEISSKLALGHVYIASPPTWWLVGFYLVTTAFTVLDYYRGRLFWSIRSMLFWIVLGLGLSWGSPAASDLTCTFLSVGHGLSVLIKCPNGSTLLYDAGSMAGGHYVARTIEEALWASGSSRLDAIVVSHADSDHCNAIPKLIDVLPSAALFVHSSFLDWTQQPVADTLNKADVLGIDIRLLAAGQSLELDPRVSIRVLHPTPSFRSKRDNPNSIVLCIEYATRCILLTGDLEYEGLECLVQTPPIEIDVMLAPHHGSLNANTHDLVRWASPEWVIASSSDPDVSQRLAAIYGRETQVLSTSSQGAIRCRISPNGGLTVESFRSVRWSQ